MEKRMIPGWMLEVSPEMQQKFDEVNMKILNVGLTRLESMNADNLQWLLGISIILEAYEKSRVIQNEIDKRNDNGERENANDKAIEEVN